MKATEAKMLDFLKKSPQFRIPIYQRSYSWGERECRQLWDDIIRCGNADRVPAHFVGSIVYVEQGLYHVSSHYPLLVIDGQQRLTTVSLLIEALARSLGSWEPVDGFSARKLRNYYLFNPEEEGERRYKLVLSQTDRDSLTALLDGRHLPEKCSLRLKANFDYFTGQVAAVGADLESLCKGLAKLIIVDISLNRDQDNPQLIFESLNSTGKELSQADLIRNFVLMGLEPDLQQHLYTHYWRPMEVGFGQEGYSAYFDAFMRHYLTIRTGDIPNVGAVYQSFKDFAASRPGPGVEPLVADVRTFARYYCAMALGAEPDPDLSEAFQDLRELKVDVAYPFLLELYHDYATGVLPKAEFLTAVRLVESYVFRRVICAIPTNSLNKTFATANRALKKDRYLESIKAYFLLLPSYRRFPGDDEFKRDILTRDLYNLRSRTYCLRRLENRNRKERVPVDEYTIEHILPQNPNLSLQWQADLGSEWEHVQATWLHTLGNLTLTGYNSEFSDRPFREKRDMPGGFRESPLRLNDGLGTLQRWNEDAIRNRAAWLADKALQVWPVPALDAEALNAYRPHGATTGYTIDDHPYLVAGAMREVFETLRREVLALDPCITEEFLKLYVAYKAETNFLDVVPQTKRLRLSFNLAFPEIDDPRGICKDVSGVGRWGNGDVECHLSGIEDVPYVVGLARQALEKQLGNGGLA